MMRVLVMEQDAAARRRLRALLEDNNFEVFEATAAAGARQAHGNRVRTVLADAMLLAEDDLIALASPVPVVLIAEAPSVNEAVDCMRRGASDYLAWPCNPDRVVAAVRAAATGFVAGVAMPGDLSAIVGCSPSIRELKERIAQAAQTNDPVLIQGEPGTGKELVARALHDASDRRYAPLVTFNCATTVETSIEPTLFGYDLAPAAASQPGPGLIGAAQAGTLVIKDVDLMPLAAQARLLHFLDHGQSPTTATAPEAAPAPQVDVRVVATAHLDVRQLASHGHFHTNLLERLVRTTLRVPPLRERGDDLVQIAHAVLGRAATRLNKSGLEFTAAALVSMRNHPWPGNVRELNHAVSRAAALSDAAAIDSDLLPFDTAEDDAVANLQRATTGSLEDFFVRFVLANQDQFTETELASQLGISRKSLWERRQRLNIPRRGARNRGPRQPSTG